MDALAESIIDAHGGLERWNAFRHISADLMQGGALWALKGRPNVLDRTRVFVDLKEQWASHSPFGDASKKSVNTPNRVALVASDGEILEALEAPRSSFAGHTLETPWTDLQLAYFAGVAMWTYLNVPFLLARPGVDSAEIEPWTEDGERWRRLSVRFPDDIATHSAVQTLYVDDGGLIRRHDYDVEIAGSTPGAHYVSNYQEVEGIRFPTRRRIFPRQPDGRPFRDMLVVSIDLSGIELG